MSLDLNLNYDIADKPTRMANHYYDNYYVVRVISHVSALFVTRMFVLNIYESIGISLRRVLEWHLEADLNVVITRDNRSQLSK